MDLDIISPSDWENLQLGVFEVGNLKRQGDLCRLKLRYIVHLPLMTGGENRYHRRKI